MSAILWRSVEAALGEFLATPATAPSDTEGCYALDAPLDHATAGGRGITNETLIEAVVGGVSARDPARYDPVRSWAGNPLADTFRAAFRACCPWDRRTRHRSWSGFRLDVLAECHPTWKGLQMPRHAEERTMEAALAAEEPPEGPGPSPWVVLEPEPGPAPLELLERPDEPSPAATPAPEPKPQELMQELILIEGGRAIRGARAILTRPRPAPPAPKPGKNGVVPLERRLDPDLHVTPRVWMDKVPAAKVPHARLVAERTVTRKDGARIDRYRDGGGRLWAHVHLDGRVWWEMQRASWVTSPRLAFAGGS